MEFMSSAITRNFVIKKSSIGSFTFQLAKLKSEYEQQHLEMEKIHSGEMEKILEQVLATN